MSIIDIRSDISTEKINNEDLVGIRADVTANTAAIALKADATDLPIGIEDQSSVGELVSIEINTAEGILNLTFAGASYSITGLSIATI